MTRTIRMKDIAGLKANTTTAPYATTEPAKIGGFRPAPGTDGGPEPQLGQMIFSDDFDSQPDWHSGLPENNTGEFPVNGAGPDRTQVIGTHTLPENWYSARQDPRWSESMGFTGGHEAIEILASNSDKALNGTGKSSVHWRDSDEGTTWNSDSILAKYIPEGMNSVYAKFYIKFDPNWTPFGETGQTKLFRISAFDGDGSFYGFGSDRDNGPVFFWDYEATSGGARINVTTRGFPISSNYSMGNPERINWPRQSGPLNFGVNVRDLDGDGTEDQQNTLLYDLTSLDPSLLDQMRNEWIDRNAIQSGTLLTSDTPSHAQVWGDVWHKIEFFLQMNTEPGAFDGHLWMWIDEQLVIKNTTMPWAGDDTQTMPKWNWFGPGGNSFFHAYPDSDRRQEWYSIDDLEVWDGIPEGRIV